MKIWRTMKNKINDKIELENQLFLDQPRDSIDRQLSCDKIQLHQAMILTQSLFYRKIG